MQLSGVPMLEFVKPEVKKLARDLVIARDLTREEFRITVDAKQMQQFTQEQFVKVMLGIRSGDFKISEHEVKEIFLCVTQQTVA